MCCSLSSSSFHRIKEELGGPEHSQEAVTIGWQRFKQLTGQFSSGDIDSSCYLSSFLNLFPNDPHRRHTEVSCPPAYSDALQLLCDALSSDAVACFESLRPRVRATEQTCKQRTQPFPSFACAHITLSRQRLRSRWSQSVFAVICTLYGRLPEEVMLRLSLDTALLMQESLLLPLSR